MLLLIIVIHIMLLSHIKGFEKLAINSMIGNFKPNTAKRENWKSVCITKIAARHTINL
jgi:hypothetical protein